MRPGFGPWEKGIADSEEENWDGWPPPGSIVRVGKGRFTNEVEVVRLHWMFGDQMASVRLWYIDRDEPDLHRPMYMSFYLPQMEILSVPPESIGKADWRRGLVGADRKRAEGLVDLT
jgi:hypothetical protein